MVPCGLLNFCGSTIYPFVAFWKLNPKDVGTSCSKPFFREQDNPLIIPVIVQRVLGRVIDAYSRLPYHIDYSFVAQS